MKKRVFFSVLSNDKVGDGLYLITLKSLSIDLNENAIKHILPGHFCEVNLHREKILLRRPFAIFDHNGVDTIQIMYKVVGEGTNYLRLYKKDDVLDVILPLGNSFEAVSDSKVIIVSGGIGIASVYKLAMELGKLNNKIYFFYGAQNKNSLPYLEEIKAISDEIFISTDDGSLGEKGFVTDPLKRFLDQNSDEYTIYGCGPSPLLYTVSDIAKIRKLKSYLSFEAKMACGIGVCAGCVIKAKVNNEIQYVRVCKEGPIFRGEDVVYEY